MNLFDTFKQKYTAMMNPVKQSLSDNTGWVRQGNFTPVKQIQNISQSAPVQNFTTGLKQSPVYQFGQTLGQSVASPFVNKTLQQNTQQYSQNINTALKMANQAKTQAEKQKWLNLAKSNQNLLGQGVGNVQQQYNKTGLQIAGEGLGTGASLIGGAKLTPKTALTMAGLSGGISKIMGGSFMEGAGTGLAYSPVYAGVAQVTNPLLSKVVNLSPVKIGAANRITAGLSNVGQGIVSDISTGQKTTPLSMGIDLATGIVGGKGQFDTGLKVKGMQGDGKLYQSDIDKVKEVITKLGEEKKAGNININFRTEVSKLADDYNKGFNLMPQKEWKRLSLEDQYKWIGNKLLDLKASGEQIQMGIVGKNKPISQLEPKIEGGIKIKQEPTLKLKPTQINTDEYLKQLKQEQQITGAKPSLKPIKLIEDIKTKLVDSTAPIEDILFKTIKKNNLVISPEKNISNQIDRVLRSRELAGQFAKDNGLVDAIKGVPDINKLDQYLIAKHSSEVNTITGRNIQADKQLVNQLQGEYEPYAKQVIQYGQKLLDYSVESGLVSPQLATQLKKQYPSYVPLNRIFSEIEKATPQGTGKGVASLSKQTIVQKLKGSERTIANPTESLLTKTLDAFSQGERNISGKLLASYKDLPNNPFLIRELKSGESATHTFSFLDNGIKRTFETTPEIANSAKFLDKRQLGLIGNILAMPVRLARVGITGINLPFIGSNLARDQVGAFINSDKALKTSIANPKVFLQSLFTAIGHGKEYDNWIRAAGGGTSFDISRSAPNVTVKQIRSNRNIGTKIAYIVTHPGELLRTVENVIGRSEEMTRLQQFIGTRDALLKEGRTLNDANILAAKASRENTVNFARSGDWGKALNSVFMYLNAGIQGSRTLMRNLSQRPLQTASKIAISTFFPVATITAWNMGDDKRKEAYNDIQDWEKDNNLVLVPPNPTKDPKTGKWNVIKIPLPQGVSNLTVPVRKSIEGIYGSDGATAKDVGLALIGTSTSLNVQSPNALLGQFIPQAVKPELEMSLNKNLFTGSDIVPKYIDGKPSSSLLPEQQVREDTSGTARIIAKPLGVSPIKIEQFTKSTLGGVGSQLLNASDQALSSMGLIPKEQVGGQSINEGFSSRFTEATGGKQLSDLYNSIDKANQTGTKLDLNQSAVNKDKIYYPVIVKHKDGTTSYTLKSEPNIGYNEPYVSSGKKTFETSPEAPKSTMERINLAAKSIVTNPTNAKNVITAIFTQERMRKMTGDTLILERENNLNKTSNSTDAVDHIIPLSLGGNNSDSNLRYISSEANNAKAKLETKLYKQLLNKEITGEEARKQISDYIDKYETTNITTEKSKPTGTQYQIKDKTTGNIDKIDLSPIEAPVLTGLTELDKKAKSKYTSAVNKQVEDIYKLYEDNQLTAAQANSMISALKTKSKKTTGTGKVKKIKKIKFKTPKKISTKAKVAKVKVTTSIPKSSIKKVKLIKYK